MHVIPNMSSTMPQKLAPRSILYVTTEAIGASISLLTVSSSPDTLSSIPFSSLQASSAVDDLDFLTKFELSTVPFL